MTKLKQLLVLALTVMMLGTAVAPTIVMAAPKCPTKCPDGRTPEKCRCPTGLAPRAVD